MHGHPGHSHGHDHAHAAPTLHDRRYTIAIALNLGFVVVEAAAGFIARSTALLSDATHNLSDVLGLALAAGAAWLAQRRGNTQRTYGFAKATVLAALANAIVLIVACGGILWEAVLRFQTPVETQPILVMAVAGVGVLMPYASIIVSWIPAMILMGIGGDSVGAIVGMSIAFHAIQAIEQYVLTPKLLGDAAELHPVTLLVGVFVMASLFGLFGALLAVPLTAIAKTMGREFLLPYFRSLAQEKPG